MKTEERDLPITQGECYSVLQPFDGLTTGDVVRLVKRGYSRYDGLSIFIFADVHGYAHSIEIPDDAPSQVWVEWSSKLSQAHADSLSLQPPMEITQTRIFKRSEIVMPNGERD